MYVFVVLRLGSVRMFVCYVEVRVCVCVCCVEVRVCVCVCVLRLG